MAGESRSLRFVDLPIWAKIAAAVTFLGFVFLVVGGGGAVMLFHAGMNMQTMSQLSDQQTVVAQLVAGQLRSHVYADQLVRADDQAVRSQMVEQWLAADAQLQETIEATTFTGEAWTDFQASWQVWSELRDLQIVPAVQAGDLAGAGELLTQGTADPDAGMVPLQRLQDDVNAELSHTLEAARTEIAITIVVLSSSFVVGTVISAVITVRVTRRITSTLHSVETTLRQMSDGDLTATVTVDSRDEAGRMAQALQHMQQSLRTSMVEVKRGVGEVVQTAERMRASNTVAAGSTRETSDQAVRAAAAAEQVSRNIEVMAGSTGELQQSISEIAANAASAAQVADEGALVAAAANGQVGRLGEASLRIGEVAKAITRIAAQTNLLALNATIEAARAGEAGKGFAVVAEEVKELAQETARATEEVAVRIESIQTETTGAVEAIDRIGSIITAIDGYQTTIAAAVEEQAATAVEMNRGVDEVATGSRSIAGSIGSVAQSAGTSADVVDQVEREVAGLVQVARSIEDAVQSYVLE